MLRGSWFVEPYRRFPPRKTIQRELPYILQYAGDEYSTERSQRYFNAFSAMNCTADFWDPIASALDESHKFPPSMGLRYSILALFRNAKGVKLKFAPAIFSGSEILLYCTPPRLKLSSPQSNLYPPGGKLSEDVDREAKITFAIEAGLL